MYGGREAVFGPALSTFLVPEQVDAPFRCSLRRKVLLGDEEGLPFGRHVELIRATGRISRIESRARSHIDDVILSDGGGVLVNYGIAIYI